ncbi:hypothetical protein [[Haemophilus] ducreyi]|uniref:Necessary for collagen adhesion A1 n=1 Tax=Haemophilus ducreyi TaxID=730 RepID=Q58ZK4_HAEDC|nr:hypothetical protein [[Haemophilus] ducreyi]AAU12599.1 necessary for collagen adhesion A2 [[Haemophilus] ducreyi ATCC 33921]AAU12594.1 necessary for collagen adhesion A2 [[Haemophilus] ducreyi]AAU12595.1 necessary for collagen adhesion A2 [[Haemophilus] ducreyi]AAU12597.1 necessary for collagen adhesion A1 [[Haemophilus] ducreyi]AAU12598.1 necessary for collagen adhesion A2 [[Haemophilus] ducreyi]
MKKIITILCLACGFSNFGHAIVTPGGIPPKCYEFLYPKGTNVLSKLQTTPNDNQLEQINLSDCKLDFPWSPLNTFADYPENRRIETLLDLWRVVRWNRGYLQEHNANLYDLYQRMNALESLSGLGNSESIAEFTKTIYPLIGGEILKQVNQKVHELRKETYMNTANTAAMSSLNFGNSQGISFGAAIGGHKGQHSLALGTAYTDYQTQVNVKIALPVRQPKPSNITYGIGFVYNFQ